MGLLDLAKFMDDHEISWLFDKQSVRLNAKSFSTITGWVHGPAYHASSTYGTFQPPKNFAISWSIFLWDDLHVQPKLIHLSPKFTHGFHPFSSTFYHFYTIFPSPKEVEGMAAPLVTTRRLASLLLGHRRQLGEESTKSLEKMGDLAWKITIFNGKIHDISMAIFNCYVSSPEGT